MQAATGLGASSRAIQSMYRKLDCFVTTFLEKTDVGCIGSSHTTSSSRAQRRDPIGIERNKLLHHLVIRNDGRGEHGLYSGGGLRTFVACSNAYAYRINAASLNAPPVNEILTGRSATYPEGTEMLPYPETAA